jgi:hypothetical protein
LPPYPFLDPGFDQWGQEPIQISEWEFDEDFPYGPKGAKPKQIRISPNPTPANYLLGEHRYLFKAPGGPWEQQIWSEVIAFKLGRILGVPVPPAFIAYNGNTPGVLVQFFYLARWLAPVSFIHGIDLLQQFGLSVDERRGSLKENINACRLVGVPGWREWWARTLAFDALIGNTDRHSENWGVLVNRSDPSQPEYDLAPAFDNGTSLGFVVRDEDLRKYRDPKRLAAFVQRGKHHFGWTAPDINSAQHIALCGIYSKHYVGTSSIMRSVIQLTDQDLDRVLDWCTRFNFIVPFTAERADFVRRQIQLRRRAIGEAIGI